MVLAGFDEEQDSLEYDTMQCSIASVHTLIIQSVVASLVETCTLCVDEVTACVQSMLRWQWLMFALSSNASSLMKRPPNNKDHVVNQRVSK